MTPDPVLAAAGHLPKIPADWPGWLVIAVIAVLLLRGLLKLLRII
jgi:hypothetical protein